MATSTTKLEFCSVGNDMHEECHKECYIKTKGIKRLESLSKDIQTLLVLRTGISKHNLHTICFHHELFYIKKYEMFQTSCCDPMKVHSVPVKRSLRTISLQCYRKAADKGLNLIPGKKLCSSCRNRLYNIQEVGAQVSSESSESDVAEGLEIQASKEETRSLLDKSLEYLQQSPIKLHAVPQHAKEKYGKRKVQEVSSAVADKISKVLDVQLPATSTSESTELQRHEVEQKAADLDRLVTLIKQKLPTMNRQRKLQILTLIPQSWSRQKAAQEFGVSEYMVRQARQLTLEKGICALVHPTGGKKLPEETVQVIQDFYQDDEFSREMPGMKDKVSISKNVYKQKRLLLCNLHELYCSFKAKYTSLKVGFSKFCTLRPKWCVLAGSSGTHSVCVCTIHQNVELLLHCLGVGEKYSSLILYLVCDILNPACMLRQCEQCPSPDTLKQHLYHTLDCDPDDVIEYQQWVSTDRTQLQTLTSSVEDFMEILVQKMELLIPHSYTTKKQSDYLKQLKEKISEREVIALLDFSENFSFVIQNEAQGYHWTNSQCTVHPVVIYYKNSDNANLKTSSHCFLSNDLDHDVSMVYKTQSEIVTYVKRHLPHVKHIHYFSDGCAAQYKNCKNILNLCHHTQDFQLTASWSFFATSHGKSSCDGIGGTVKRLTSKASLQRPFQDQITSVSKMFTYCNEHITGIIFHYIDKNDVDDVRSTLQQRYTMAKTIPGTRGFHNASPISQYEIGMKKTSQDNAYSLVFNFATAASKDPGGTISKLYTGCYVSCVYDKKWFVGVVNNIDRSEEDAQVTFMHPAGPSASFYWPSPRDDVCWVPFAHILSILQAPSTSSSGRTYSFLKEDLCKCDIEWQLYQKSNAVC